MRFSLFNSFLVRFITLEFTLGDKTKGKVDVNNSGASYLLKYPCSNGSDCTFYETTLPKGRYLLETWGAQGGNTNYGGVGGKGGFSRGILSISKPTKVFIHVGGQPANTPGNFTYVKLYGGYNGGGGSIIVSNCNAGGGGTDIRLNENTFYHRVLVSGGGGGGPFQTSVFYSTGAGAGGGLEGEASSWGPETNAGKQEEGGEGGYEENGGTQGSFGLGGIHGGRSAGGGGGWFGGSGSENSGANTGGAGGSGYVFNKTSFKPDDFKLTEEFHLSEGCTIQGTQTFLSPEGVEEVGHSGHGAVRITILEGSLDAIITKVKRSINTFKASSLYLFFLSH